MYTLLLLEKRKNKNNKDEVFFHIGIEDDLGYYHYGNWLNDEELNLFLQNENNITIIIESHLEKARNNYIEALNAEHAEDLGE